MTKTSNEQGFISVVYEGKTHEDLYTCLFACFLSQVEPNKVIQALTDPSWIEVMQDELLPFKLQKVWTLVEGFEDPEFPNKVYKVEKVLYGLHQAPKACQDKYADEILKKFGFLTVNTASTPMKTSKPLFKDVEAEDVDVHLYRTMVGSLMYLTASRPDIIRKSTTRGCQFLEQIDFMAMQDKHSIVVKSTTDSRTKIHIDNESTICIVKNPIFHLKTKHIEIRHNFIRDSNKKKLIQMIKIHTDQNVIDLLPKAFDVSRFQYLITSIGMLNL
ncbi:hypothetical protein Tco_0215740 [Tanacetum coccineum]